MADKNQKNPLNIPGNYYTDLSCTDCDFCREIAPQIFKRDDLEGMTYVAKQPGSPEETALAMEALESCPTETIGDDGGMAPSKLPHLQSAGE